MWFLPSSNELTADGTTSVSTLVHPPLPQWGKAKKKRNRKEMSNKCKKERREGAQEVTVAGRETGFAVKAKR